MQALTAPYFNDLSEREQIYLLLSLLEEQDELSQALERRLALLEDDIYDY